MSAEDVLQDLVDLIQGITPSLVVDQRFVTLRTADGNVPDLDELLNRTRVFELLPGVPVLVNEELPLWSANWVLVMRYQLDEDEALVELMESRDFAAITLAMVRECPASIAQIYPPETPPERLEVVAGESRHHRVVMVFGVEYEEG